jgi:hypothetical protein
MTLEASMTEYTMPDAGMRPATTPGTAPVDSTTAPDGTGWLFFAATVLVLAGAMRVVDSIWAFNYKGSLPSGLQDGAFGSDLNTYAWVWLVVGIVLILSGFFVLVKAPLARWVGILAAFVGGVVAITWMPYYPVWSLVYVGLSVLVLHALITYGGRSSF